jgi:hypothetical protein
MSVDADGQSDAIDPKRTYDKNRYSARCQTDAEGCREWREEGCGLGGE